MPDTTLIEDALTLARLYVANGTERRRLCYCPVCHEKCRLVVGADRCARCARRMVTEALAMTHGERGA